MAEQHHQYTGALLLLFTLLILLAGIFFTVAQSKVTGTQEYKNGNPKLKNAKNNLLTAYILAYIAAGLGLILSILYFGHISWGIKSEIPHLIVYILLFSLIIVSGIFGFIALGNISDSAITDKNGAEGWIWGALIAALLGIIILIVSGAWRAQYKSNLQKMGTYKPLIPNGPYAFKDCQMSIDFNSPYGKEFLAIQEAHPNWAPQEIVEKLNSIGIPIQTKPVTVSYNPTLNPIVNTSETLSYTAPTQTVINPQRQTVTYVPSSVATNYPTFSSV